MHFIGEKETKNNWLKNHIKMLETWEVNKISLNFFIFTFTCTELFFFGFLIVNFCEMSNLKLDKKRSGE